MIFILYQITFYHKTFAMKKLMLYLLVCLFALSCKEGDKTSSAETKSDSTKEKLDYPYTIDHPGEYWIPGDPKNALIALKSLKAFETGNITEAVSYFADSVSVRFDNYRKKIGKDSLIALFKQMRAKDSALVIKMGDWESVIGNDKKQEYVSIWYQQIETDKKGKIDSTNVMDDLKFINGKIVELDEKIQHYPKLLK